MNEMIETAWLLEKNIDGRPHWIGIIDGTFRWTPDANEALRLARHEDGDRLAEIYGGGGCRITLHGWGEIPR